MNLTQSLHEKIYFKKHIQQILNLNIQTIRRMWNRGEFPKPIMINGRCAWHSDVIKAWLDNLEATRTPHCQQDKPVLKASK